MRMWAADNEIDFVGLSFVRQPSDVRELKELLRSRSSSARVIAKIEKQEAIDQLDAIITEADAIMVARGDLGVEIDVAQMPIVQKRIVAACRTHQKPVIIATQMLDSMQNSRRPTRAEVTDVANAILDGGDACMLSGETAIGKYPRSRGDDERSGPGHRRAVRDNVPQPPGQFSCRGAAPDHRGRRLRGRAHGRRNGRQAGRRGQPLRTHGPGACRSSEPTCRRSASATAATLRQMCLYWGVIPLGDVPADNGEEMLTAVTNWGLESGMVTRRRLRRAHRRPGPARRLAQPGDRAPGFVGSCPAKSGRFGIPVPKRPSYIECQASWRWMYTKSSSLSLASAGLDDNLLPL